MKNYELLYILPASQTSEETVKNFEDVKKHIEKFGGNMLETLLEHPFLTKTGMSKDEEPEELKAIPIVKRKLAYAIKHEKFGFYCLVNFEAEAKKIQDIDEYLRLNNNVLRHIIVQADPMTKEQLELLQKLFARKKAEQDKEEAERESGAAKEEPKRAPRKPAEETVSTSAEKEEVKEEKTKEEAAEEKPAKEDVKEEVKEEKAASEVKEDVPEKKAAKESKKEKEDAKEDKEEKKSGRKSKIKLEELEDKLDEILEDTIV